MLSAIWRPSSFRWSFLDSKGALTLPPLSARGLRRRSSTGACRELAPPDALGQDRHPGSGSSLLILGTRIGRMANPTSVEIPVESVSWTVPALGVDSRETERDPQAVIDLSHHRRRKRSQDA
jgi:hypothetical protein